MLNTPIDPSEPKRRVRVPRHERICANPWCREPFKAHNANRLYHDPGCQKTVERERKQALRAGREPFGGLFNDTPKAIGRLSSNKAIKEAIDQHFCELEEQAPDPYTDPPRTGWLGLGFYRLLCGSHDCPTRKAGRYWKVPTRQLPDGEVWLCPKCRDFVISTGGDYANP